MEMGRIERLRVFFGRTTVLLLLLIVTFSGSLVYFAPARTVSASWAGWDGMDTIAIIPLSDEFLIEEAYLMGDYELFEEVITLNSTEKAELIADIEKLIKNTKENKNINRLEKLKKILS